MGRRRIAATAAAASCLELASLGRNGGSASPSSASVCSAFSYLEGEADDYQADEFERRLDALFEKRSSTREKALEALAVMLRVDYRDRDCVAHSETLTSRCLHSLKRGSPVEACLAAQLLGLHVLTLGQPNEGLFLALRPELERTAFGGGGGGGCCNGAAAVSMQVAALEALALAAFVLCEDECGTLELMERLRGLWGKGDCKARAAAVRCWSFLLTCLGAPPPPAAAAALLPTLGSLLHQPALELRLAAGDAVGVLQGVLPELGLGLAAEEGGGGGEDGLLAGMDEEEEAGEGEAEARERGRRSSDNSGGGGDGLEEVVERMQELATNKGDRLRRSRRERASQRSAFRGVLRALSGSAPPAVRLKLQHGDALCVEGSSAVHRLTFLRGFLAGGFQAHLQRNPLLHDVFSFTPRPEPPERLTGPEKRALRGAQSEGARARAAERRWCRDAKASRTASEF